MEKIENILYFMFNYINYVSHCGVNRTRCRGRHRGVLMFVILVIGVLASTTVFGIMFLNSQIESMNARTFRVQQLAFEAAEALMRQLEIYAVRVAEMRKVTQETEKNALKYHATDAWFTRTQIETNGVLPYADLRERFSAIAFENVDRTMNTITAEFKNFSMGVLSRDAVFNEDDLMVSGRAEVNIVMNDGYRLSPMFEGRVKYGKQGSGRSSIDEMWGPFGVRLTFPVNIKEVRPEIWTK